MSSVLTLALPKGGVLVFHDVSESREVWRFTTAHSKFSKVQPVTVLRPASMVSITPARVLATPEG